MRLSFRHPVNQTCISSAARACTAPKTGSSYTLSPAQEAPAQEAPAAAASQATLTSNG